MSIRERIGDVTRFTPGRYRPFVVAGYAVGRIRHAFADLLMDFDDVFEVTPAAVSLSPTLANFEDRTQAVADVLAALKASGHIPGWRGEPYPVSVGFFEPPLLTIERAAAVLFGTMAYGVNLNGYVRTPDDICMWIAKRSADKPVEPGKLDHIVAGGQPHGISVRDNLIKECWEEAAIPAELAARAVPVGTLSYLTERDEGLRHSVFFNFDLDLGTAFQPTPTDGEVDVFYLWPMRLVLDRLRDTDDFKFDVPIGILDFAVRHGLLPPDDSDYLAVCEAVRLGAGAPIPAR